eukprot:4075778-Amphidinium_carterae.1
MYREDSWKIARFSTTSAQKESFRGLNVFLNQCAHCFGNQLAGLSASRVCTSGKLRVWHPGTTASNEVRSRNLE